MKSLRSRLSWIEAQIQSLIEGSLARLFPPSLAPTRLMDLLLKAMQDGIQEGTDGKIFAPNLYIILVPPSQAKLCEENQPLANELTRLLGEVAEEAGIVFPAPLALRFELAPELSPVEMRVVAQNSLEFLSPTSDIPLPSAPEAKVPLPNAFLIVDGTRTYPLNQTVINIGRRSDNQLTIDDRRVSRVHAQLRFVQGHFVIFDLDSAGGTWVNGRRIRQHTLRPGDVISLAGVPLVFGQETPTVGETQQIPTRME